MCPVLPISCSSISLSPGVHSFKLTPPSRVLLKSLAVAIRQRTRSSYIPKIPRLQTFRFVGRTSHFPERGVSILQYPKLYCSHQFQQCPNDVTLEPVVIPAYPRSGNNLTKKTNFCCFGKKQKITTRFKNSCAICPHMQTVSSAKSLATRVHPAGT